MRMFIFLVIWVGILQLFKVDAAAVKYGLACTMRSLCNGQTVEEQKQLPETRLIAIGDIHGSSTGLLEDLYDANITTSRDICMWQSQPIHTILVQSGDLVDRGPGALESLKCLQNLQNTAKDFNGEVVRILGNHEIWWLEGYLNYKHKADTRKKIREFVDSLKEDILSHKVVGAYLHHVNNVPIIFNHAGYNKAFLEKLKSDDLLNKYRPETIVNVTNQDLINTIIACKKASTCKLSGSYYEAGPERGGRGVGGPYWTDFSVLQREVKGNPYSNDFIQVVGHSMADCYRQYDAPSSFQQCPEGLIRATKDLSAFAVDGGMYLGGRGFLEIGNDGHFRSHEKLGKEKRVVDFTQSKCSAQCSESNNKKAEGEL